MTQERTMGMLNAVGLGANALGLGVVLIAVLMHVPTADAAVVLGFVVAIPYVTMVLIHLNLGRFTSQRIVALVASSAICAIGIAISTIYLRIPIGETSPGMGIGYFLIAVYTGVVALVALVVCGFIQRAAWHRSRHEAHRHEQENAV